MRPRRTLPKRASVLPDRAKPLTWRAWKARNRNKRWYWRYPLAIEWALEWVNHGLYQWAFVEFLEYAGKFTVLVVVILWVLEADNRAKERHYRAWDLINAARGSTGDGGRKDALQDLNKDGVSLAGAPLEQAWLPEVNLQGANLSRANLKEANLFEAHLERALLGEAHLEGANLRQAHLEGAWLGEAHLERADLGVAHLERAWLREAHLEGADLVEAHLEGAHLQMARFEGADLRGAHFEGANLLIARFEGADLRGAHFEGANLLIARFEGANLEKAHLEGADLGLAHLERARNLTQEQLNAANGNDWTQLPDGLTRPAHWPSSEGNKGQSGDGTTGQ